MYDRLILTDVDEVLLNWRTPFTDWIKNYKNFPKANTNLEDHHSIDKWLGITDKEAVNLVEEFNSSTRFGMLDPLPLADEYLKELHKKHKFSIIAITACSKDAWTFNVRQRNLIKHFGDIFDNIHCVGLGESKKKYLYRYRPTFWIEDKWKHALDGADLGHDTFIINYTHSDKENDPRITKVDNWKQIHDNILDKIKK